MIGENGIAGQNGMKGWHVNVFKRGAAKIKNCLVQGPVECHVEEPQHGRKQPPTTMGNGTTADVEQVEEILIAHIEKEIELDSGGLELELVSYTTNTFDGQ